MEPKTEDYPKTKEQLIKAFKEEQVHLREKEGELITLKQEAQSQLTCLHSQVDALLSPRLAGDLAAATEIFEKLPGEKPDDKILATLCEILREVKQVTSAPKLKLTPMTLALKSEPADVYTGTWKPEFKDYDAKKGHIAAVFTARRINFYTGEALHLESHSAALYRVQATICTIPVKAHWGSLAVKLPSGFSAVQEVYDCSISTRPKCRRPSYYQTHLNDWIVLYFGADRGAYGTYNQVIFNLDYLAEFHPESLPAPKPAPNPAPNQAPAQAILGGKVSGPVREEEKTKQQKEAKAKEKEIHKPTRELCDYCDGAGCSGCKERVIRWDWSSNSPCR